MVPNSIQAGHKFDFYANISISNDLMHHAYMHTCMLAAFFFKISVCINHKLVYIEEPINRGSLIVTVTWIVEPVMQPITIIMKHPSTCVTC